MYLSSNHRVNHAGIYNLNGISILKFFKNSHSPTSCIFLTTNYSPTDKARHLITNITSFIRSSLTTKIKEYFKKHINISLTLRISKNYKINTFLKTKLLKKTATQIILKNGSISSLNSTYRTHLTNPKNNENSKKTL